MAKAIDQPQSGAIFISCGNLRSCSIIAPLERDVEKPVITSNQAMIWDMLKQLKLNDPIAEYGRLMHTL